MKTFFSYLCASIAGFIFLPAFFAESVVGVGISTILLIIALVLGPNDE